MIKREPFFPHRERLRFGWHAHWDGTNLDQLDFSDCSHVIDNGLRVKFVELCFFLGITLDFLTPDISLWYR